MRVIQSLLGQAVFKVAAFHLDASVKTSSLLPGCVSMTRRNVT